MTEPEKAKRLAKIHDAYNAGFISANDCMELVKKLEQEYYLAKHGEFDLSTLG